MLKQRATESAPSSRPAVTLVLTYAMSVSVAHSYIIGPLGPYWRDQFTLTNAQLGFIGSSVVALAAVGSLALGPVVDRYGDRRLLYWLFLLSALGLLVMGVARQYSWLLVGAAIGGLSQAVANPATNRAVGRLIHAGRQGRAIGWKQSGVQVTGFLAGLTLPAAAELVGWRPAVIAAAALTFAGVLGVRGVIPVEGGIAQRRLSKARTFRAADRRGVAWLAVFGFFMGAALNACLIYLPSYVVDSGGTTVEGGLVLAVIGFVGISGRLWWARLVERGSRSGSAYLLWLSLVAVAAAILLLASAGGVRHLVWPAAVLIGASLTAWNAPGMLLLVRDVDNTIVGKATGIVQMAFLVGLMVSPLAVGLTLDTTLSYAYGWLVVLGFAAGSVGTAAAWARSSVGESRA